MTVAPAIPLPVSTLSVDNIRLSVVVLLTSGCSGFTLTVTLIVLEDFACVAAGCASVPDWDAGNVTLTL